MACTTTTCARDRRERGPAPRAVLQSPGPGEPLLRRRAPPQAGPGQGDLRAPEQGGEHRGPRPRSTLWVPPVCSSTQSSGQVHTHSLALPRSSRAAPPGTAALRVSSLQQRVERSRPHWSQLPQSRPRKRAPRAGRHAHCSAPLSGSAQHRTQCSRETTKGLTGRSGSSQPR